jgi:hypothetical protein
MNFPSIREMRVPISNLIYDFACVRHAFEIYSYPILHIFTSCTKDARLGVDLHSPCSILILYRTFLDVAQCSVPCFTHRMNVALRPYNRSEELC